MAKAFPSDFDVSDKAYIARIWRDYIRPQRRTLAVAMFFMVVLALATAAYTFVVSYIIEAGKQLNTETNGSVNAQLYAGLILPVLVGITLVSGLSNYFQRILCNKIALIAVGNMQKQMFASAHGADYQFFAQSPIGTLISKFTHDVTVMSNALIRTLSNLIKDLLTVIFTIAAMLLLSWQLSLMVLILYPLAAWPIIIISKRLRGNAHAVQEHIGTLTSELKDSFSGARMVKLYGLETRENERLGQSFNARIRLYLKLVTQQARVDPILEVMGGLAIAGVVIFGIFLVASGDAQFGHIAGVLTGLLVLSPRIRALGTLNTVVQEGLAAATRIYAVIDETPNIIDTPNPTRLGTVTGDIIFEALGFIYPDGTQALDGISLRIKSGETVAFVGPSGGGKSTIFNVLQRLYETSNGHVFIGGTDIRNINLESLRSHIALVSQEVTLFHDTVAANIGFGDLSASRAEIIAAAKASDAHGFITDLAGGYDTVLGEDGNTLSGGQKQRLSIARALLRDAPILLLDEATSALDSHSESKVQAALERLSNGRTTLVIAHRLSTIQKADCIYVLEAGKIVESGPHKTLIQKLNGVYRNLKILQN